MSLIRWTKRRRNDRGEWTVIDLRRDYRICHYNHEGDDGAHIHAPLDGPVVANIDLISEQDAVEVLELYGATYDAYEAEAFEEVVTAWRSASKNV